MKKRIHVLAMVASGILMAQDGPSDLGQQVNDLIDAGRRSPTFRTTRVPATISLNVFSAKNWRCGSPLAPVTLAGAAFDTSTTRERNSGVKFRLLPINLPDVKSSINVEACHDSQGQIFQGKLQR